MRSTAESGAGVVPEVRRGGAYAPGGDPQLAYPSGRVGRRDRAVPWRAERGAGLAGGQLGELDGKRSGRLRDTDRHTRGGGNNECGDELHSGRTRDDGPHDDEHSGEHTGDDSGSDGGDEHHHAGHGARGKRHSHNTRDGECPYDEHPGRETARDRHRDDGRRGNGDGDGDGSRNGDGHRNGGRREGQGES